ncbi:MAG: putative nucleic acid-binding protein [Granulosicoccus sp.]|jgi:predicted nucleic acid-binding protein
MVIIVDSSVWIDYFNGNSTAESDFLDRILGIQDIAVGDLILTEVLQGFRSDKDYKTAKSIVGDFDVVEMLGRERAISAASKYRNLRKTGITVRKTNDVIIASYCIDEKIPLLFSDKDFEPFVKDLGLLTAIRGI